MITEQQLKKIAPKAADIKELVVALNQLLPKYNITTYKRICAFVAQYAMETQGFTKFVENTNYTKAERLLEVFPKYFKSKLVAAAYAGKPQAIANRVYADRFGNGDEQSGDGYKYRGRGLCHLTFKSNYYQFTLATGVEAIRHPELLEEIHYAVLAGCWFWDSHKLNALADKDDFIGLTKAINGGLNGVEDRRKYWELCKVVFMENKDV